MILLALIGCAVAAHFLANWRAEARWQRYCIEARARGVKLILAEFAPPEIPDAENFAALPMFRAIFAGGVHRPMELPTSKSKVPGFGDPIKGVQIDWKAWQKFCRDNDWITEVTVAPPQDVLRGLEHYAPQFKEWSEWRHRSRCYFSLNLEAGFALALPHLSTFSDAGRLFSLRIRARLALGDSAGAYAELREGLQAWRALKEEPLLISGVVQISTLAMLLNAVGAGLKERAWAEAELEKIATDFSEIQVWESYRRAYASERAFNNWLYESMIDSSKRGSLLDSLSKPPARGAARMLLALIPKRVYRENQLRNNRYFDEILARANAVDRFNVNTPLSSSEENIRGLVEPYYFFFFRQLAPADIAHRSVMMNTQIDEVRIACALERYRFAHQRYPETLQELTPALLEAVPLDPFTGKPLIYRQHDDTYSLYGLGKNHADDGGIVDPKLRENKQLDDIWLYAPPAS